MACGVGGDSELDSATGWDSHLVEETQAIRGPGWQTEHCIQQGGACRTEGKVLNGLLSCREIFIEGDSREHCSDCEH